MPSSGAVLGRAHAKLNLVLSVGGPEPADSPKPGFHRIASWIAAIDLYDELLVESLPDDRESSYKISWMGDAIRPSAIDWPIPKDLAVRAHRLLEEHVGRRLPVHMELRKRIPIGAGLGGGSSDAAAMLRAVNELFRLKLTAGEFESCAARLGSDVAFFLDNGEPSRNLPRPALVTGFGDHIERIPFIPASALLVVPPFGCPTAGVYGAYDRLLAGSEQVDASIRQESHPTAEANIALVKLLIRRAIEIGYIEPSLCFNALTAPAIHLEPRLAGIIETVTEFSQMQAHLTGSGSCIFVIGSEGQIAGAGVCLAHALGRAELAGCRLLKTRLI